MEIRDFRIKNSTLESFMCNRIYYRLNFEKGVVRKSLPVCEFIKKKDLNKYFL